MSDRQSIVRWPNKVDEQTTGKMSTPEFQDAIARGVLKGGLWLAVILGSVALLVVVGNYGVSKFVKNWNEQQTLMGY
jgi:hypothetical protein